GGQRRIGEGLQQSQALSRAVVAAATGREGGILGWLLLQAGSVSWPSVAQGQLGISLPDRHRGRGGSGGDGWGSPLGPRCPRTDRGRSRPGGRPLACRGWWAARRCARSEGAGLRLPLAPGA